MGGEAGEGRASLWFLTASEVSHLCLQPSDECGIVAQIAGPLAAVDISAYYISTFNFDHALVRTWLGQEVPAGSLRSRWAGRGTWQLA